MRFAWIVTRHLQKQQLHHSCTTPVPCTSHTSHGRPALPIHLHPIVGCHPHPTLCERIHQTSPSRICMYAVGCPSAGGRARAKMRRKVTAPSHGWTDRLLYPPARTPLPSGEWCGYASSCPVYPSTSRSSFATKNFTTSSEGQGQEGQGWGTRVGSSPRTGAVMAAVERGGTSHKTACSSVASHP